MRIFFLILAAFSLAYRAYAEIECSEESDLAFQKTYEYSVKNLPEAVEKKHKKTPKKYIPGKLNYFLDEWDVSGNNSKSNIKTDLIFNQGFGGDNDYKHHGKGPTHREVTDRQHDLIRQKMLGDGASRIIKPPDRTNPTMDKMLKRQVLDKLLPSFKTRIDL